VDKIKYESPVVPAKRSVPTKKESISKLIDLLQTELPVE